MIGPITGVGISVSPPAARATAVPVAPELPGPPPTGAADNAFSTLLENAITRVDAAQRSADSALNLLSDGDQVDVHRTMIELEKADITLRTMISVRDKFISAYEQVMNMAI